MASPVFSSSKEFKADPLLAQQSTAEDLQRQYEAPSATPGYADDRMSYRGVVNKGVGLGLVTLGLGAGTYFYVAEQPGAMLLAFGAGILALVVGLIAAFKRTPGVGLVGTYAAAEGVFLGALTAWIETYFEVPGAGVQALLATGITFMVCLWLYRSGKVRYTAKMQKIFMIGAISYLVFSVVNIGIMFLNPDMGAFGARSVEISIGGLSFPLGAIIGVVAVLLACISLIGDFDFIDNGVKRGLEKKLEWKAAFGLIVTLVWLYTEFLRLIALFSGRD
ncbi:Bax inhibitor-1/YccA family protein [Demequina lignilytica]|uniref:Bax inhibitor-1/YccA family protein n=1 Tax=Demequina lignilytica TaxID=3051663 RepID=A0AAW7M0W3_9MICO|nr:MULTISPECIES: Bax inhibitor-1/YccA family protein [unclassified Demequina]MDN4477611.1 Bax inhibitor-1/YccA family protein [Demequina sp. SYSU T00039-1]MDN4483656.1 Bax inhibitor-1/YccA family protein [Demequina sp. SYSU T0a273]MDN4488038.1 Bax inhibitor-1/YccA family protein [Demequina sp. SYSU T00039]MDN4490478.1 Bax inhibitor-1/YccA family protein [Demequina sp. SYSU T00068]